MVSGDEGEGVAPPGWNEDGDDMELRKRRKRVGLEGGSQMVGEEGVKNTRRKNGNSE